MRRAGLLLAFVLTACNPSGRDMLVAERASPDGRRVARLWCASRCDVPGDLTLTISPPIRNISLVRDGAASIGILPQSDRVLVVHTHAGKRPPVPRIAWPSRTRVAIAVACPHGVERGMRGRAVDVFALPARCDAAA